MRHHLLTHHPVLVPLASLIAVWTSMTIVAPAEARWLVVAFAVNGVITVIAAWLLLRQFIGSILMGGQGIDAVKADVQKKASEAKADAKAALAKVDELKGQVDDQGKRIGVIESRSEWTLGPNLSIPRPGP